MNRLSKNRKSGRNSGRIFFVSGAVLIIAAAVLLGSYLFQGHRAEQSCSTVLRELLPLIPERTQGTVPDTLGKNQAVLEVEGISCVGILEIPSLGESWPIAGSYEDSTDLPRLESSEEEGTAVINDAERGSLFSGITSEDIGEEVRFTDVYGRVCTWRITEIADRKGKELPNAGLILLTEDRMTGKERAVLCTAE